MKLTIKRLQRLLCALLCCVMLMGMAPGAVFAEEDGEENTEKTEQSGEPSVEDPDGTDPDDEKGDEPDTGEGDEGNGENGEPNGDDEPGENTGDGTEPGENEGEGEENGDVPNSEGPGLEDEPVIQIPEDEEDGDGDDIMTLALIEGTTGDPEFHRMTSVDELQAGSHYIIVAPASAGNGGNRIALCAGETNFVAEIVQTDATILTVPADASCVFTLSAGDTDGTWHFRTSGDVDLKLNNSDGVFKTKSTSDITVAESGDMWTLRSKDRALTWNGTAFDRTGNSTASGTPVEIWTDYVEEEPTTFYKLASLDQLADLPADASFVLVVQKNGKHYAIGNGSDWLSEVTWGTNSDGSYITVDEAQMASYVFGERGEFSTSSTGGVLNWRFTYIQLAGSLYQFAPQNTGKPFRTSRSDRNNSVMFEYGTGTDDNIYVRGNGDSYWLGVNGDSYGTTSATGNRMPVEIYVSVPENATRVRYMNTDGSLHATAFVNGAVTLSRYAPEIVKDGETYIFVGWSTESSYSGNAFLSRSNSTNLFGFNDDYGDNYFLDKAIKNLKLLGNGNPDDPYRLNVSSDITLYPVYALKGYDTVVTANEDGTMIVGISDWKADQDEKHRYQDPARERWLGSIDIAVYKDGEPWVGPVPMYFSYHNDNAADLNVKFIWKTLVDECKGKNAEEKLYAYMADINDENTTSFPDYDQSGHFIIDAVVAVQGGSEDGLVYKLNWMTDHGGQLDNVRGGTTVEIYVTTKYNVKYYLDDQRITAADWTNNTWYTTPGTRTAFSAATAEIPDNERVVADQNDGLMKREVTQVGGATEFVPHSDESGERGIFKIYTYDLHDYGNVIPIAKSPESVVPAGKTLTSTAWTLKNGSLTQTVAWSSRYEITGTKYTTGNTGYAYRDPDVIAKPDADAPYTFHLYAYTSAGTAPPTGDGNNLLLWTALLTVSLGGLTFLSLMGRKKRQK